MALIILLAGLLFALGVALMVLDAAIEQAPEGYEDQDGFHQKSRRWAGGTPASETELNRWDQIEGASCPLDLSPPLRRAGAPPFPSPR